MTKPIRRNIPVKLTHKQIEEKRQKAREYHLQRIYGITQEQYDELLTKQNHRCAVCQKHENEFKKRLHVDHNHKTGEIRGLLCYYCNNKVVGRQTDIEIAKRVYEYLSNSTGWFVPKRKNNVKRNRRKH